MATPLAEKLTFKQTIRAREEARQRSVGLDTRGWKWGVWTGSWWDRQGLDRQGIGGLTEGQARFFKALGKYRWNRYWMPNWPDQSLNSGNPQRSEQTHPHHPPNFVTFLLYPFSKLFVQWQINNLNLIKDIICIWKFLFLQRCMIESFQKRKLALIENVLYARYCSI